jgi:hypothetical protein
MIMIRTSQAAMYLLGVIRQSPLSIIRQRDSRWEQYDFGVCGGVEVEPPHQP